MNNLCQGYHIQKIIPFLPSWSLTLSLSNWLSFLRQKLVEQHMVFNSKCIYISVKRNKTIKNPQKKEVCNDSFNSFCHPLNAWAYSNFLPSIKYIIQQSPQFTNAPWSNTSRKHFINFKYAKHAILWNMPSMPSM